MPPSIAEKMFGQTQWVRVGTAADRSGWWCFATTAPACRQSDGEPDDWHSNDVLPIPARRSTSAPNQPPCLGHRSKISTNNGEIIAKAGSLPR